MNGLRPFTIWLVWIGLTVLAGCAPLLFILFLLGPPNIWNFLLIYLLPLLPIFLINLVQEQFLRVLFRGMGPQPAWQLTSIPGYLIIIPLFVFWYSPDADFWFLTTFLGIGAACVGAIMGLTQSFVLARYIRYARWWILANALGWGVSWPLGLQIVGSLTKSSSSPVISLFSWICVWLTLGVITGSAFTWLLHNQRNNAEDIRPSPLSSL